MSSDTSTAENEDETDEFNNNKSYSPLLEEKRSTTPLYYSSVRPINPVSTSPQEIYAPVSPINSTKSPVKTSERSQRSPEFSGTCTGSRESPRNFENEHQGVNSSSSPISMETNKEEAKSTRISISTSPQEIFAPVSPNSTKSPLKTSEKSQRSPEFSGACAGSRESPRNFENEHQGVNSSSSPISMETNKEEAKSTRISTKRKPDKSKIFRIPEKVGKTEVTKCSFCQQEFRSRDETSYHEKFCVVNFRNKSSTTSGTYEGDFNGNSSPSSTDVHSSQDNFSVDLFKTFEDTRNSSFEPNVSSQNITNLLQIEDPLYVMHKIEQSNAALEAIQKTKLSLFQLASNLLANGVPNNLAILKELSMLERAFYNLQHQELLHTQVLEGLKAYLTSRNKLQDVTSNKNDAERGIAYAKVARSTHSAIRSTKTEDRDLGISESSDDEDVNNAEVKSENISSFYDSNNENTLVMEKEGPSTLEMLQKTTNDVLNNASKGILANRLINDCNRSDEGYSKHRCQYCGKMFGSDSALQIHVRSHTGERPFKCNICGNRFTTRGNLKVHFERHTSRFPHIRMNSDPVPEQLDHRYPPMFNTPEESNDMTPPPLSNELIDTLRSTIKYKTAENFNIFQSLKHDINFNEQDIKNVPTANINENLPVQNDIIGRIESMNKLNQLNILTNMRRIQNVNSEENFRHLQENYTNGRNVEVEKNNLLMDKKSSHLADVKSGAIEDQMSAANTQENELQNDEENTENQTRKNTAHRFLEIRIKPDEDLKEHSESESNFDGNSEDTPNMNVEMHNPFVYSDIPSALKSPITGRLPNFSRFPPVFNAINQPSSANVEMMLQRPMIFPPFISEPDTSSNSWENLIEVEKTNEKALIEKLSNTKDSSTDPNECAICHRVMSCRSSLQMHYRTHTGHRPFRCKICRRSFTTKGNLKTHMSVHISRPIPRIPYQCPVCRRRFANGFVLQQHMRQHAIEIERDIATKFARNSNLSLPPSTSLFPSINLSQTSHFQDNLPIHLRCPLPPDLLKKYNLLPNAKVKETDTQDNPGDGEISEANFNRAEDLSIQPKSESISPRPNAFPSPTLSDHSDSEKRTSQHNIISEAARALGQTSPIAHPQETLDQNKYIASQILKSQDFPYTLNVSGQGNTTCRICFKTFACESALKIHVRSHTKERPYKCDICERSFSTKGNMKQHKITHSNEEMMENVDNLNNFSNDSSNPSFTDSSNS